jgi:hypothetical protein
MAIDTFLVELRRATGRVELAASVARPSRRRRQRPSADGRRELDDCILAGSYAVPPDNATVAAHGEDDGPQGGAVPFDDSVPSTTR